MNYICTKSIDEMDTRMDGFCDDESSCDRPIGHQ